MVARSVAAFGWIDCAFNNAGMGGRTVGPPAQRIHQMRRLHQMQRIHWIRQASLDGMLVL